MSRSFSLLFVAAGLTIRPYVPPALGPEPAYEPAEVQHIEIVPMGDAWDANVFARPHFSAPLVGNIARGTRVAVRGEVEPRDGSYCATGRYYAVEPFGWVCTADTQPTHLPVTIEPVLQVVEGTPVPYRYAMVVVAEGTFLPMWASIDALERHETPERELARGDTIALAETVHEFEGASYFVTVDNKVVPVQGTTAVKKFSEWQGVPLNITTRFPFAWVTPNKAPVFDAPSGKKLEDLPQRTRVDVLEELTVGSTRWLRIGDSRYMKASQLNEVRKLARPNGTGTHEQWIDIDLGEQVVVAYRGAEPVFATLTSSGRGPNHTPRGNYPVWGKATAITMKSQAYDDSPYYVNRVPWVLFFQAHNALHAAYWHDRFGSVKSHGCANLSPRDAQTLFEWLEPTLPPGWTSVRYWNLSEAPYVHVRNSSKAKPFAQERNVGPPDKDEETVRLEQALVRRDAQDRAAAAAVQKPTGPNSPLLKPGAPAIPVPGVAPATTPLLPFSPWR
jgi:hypothetical protein